MKIDYSLKKVLPLAGSIFLSRFCLRILALRFRKIRHYGFLANASKGKSLQLARRSLNIKLVEALTKKERKLSLSNDSLPPESIGAALALKDRCAQWMYSCPIKTTPSINQSLNTIFKIIIRINSIVATCNMMHLCLIIIKPNHIDHHMASHQIFLPAIYGQFFPAMLIALAC